MAAYHVSYRLRSETLNLTPREVEENPPRVTRIVASDAQRAISSVVNRLKEASVIASKSDIKFLEVRVAP